MPVVELTTFRLRADAEEAAFLEADARVQVEFAYRRPGIERRTTARGEDGSWLVLTLWGSEAEAEGAAEAARGHAAVAELMRLVDEDTLRTSRYATLD